MVAFLVFNAIVVLSTKYRIKSDKPFKAVERDSFQPFPLRFDAWQISTKTGLTQHSLKYMVKVHVVI